MEPTVDTPPTVSEVPTAMTGTGDVPPRRRRGNGRAKAPSPAQPAPLPEEPQVAWPDPAIASLWELRVAAPPAPPVSIPEEEPEPTSAPAAPGRADRGWRIVLLVAACWVAAIAIMFAGRVIAPPGQTGGPGQVVWPPAVARSYAEVAGFVRVDETFDGLAIDSKLAAPWTIEGAGPVRTVALPTGVDRSVSIGSDASGNATALCRPIDVPSGRDVRFALGFALGRQPSVNAKLIDLRRGGTSVVEVVVVAATGEAKAVRVASDGMLPASVPPSQGAALDLTTWRHLALTVYASGAVSWETRDSSGMDAGSGTLSKARGSLPLDMFCVLSPAGAPGAWVAMDDLLIEG